MNLLSEINLTRSESTDSGKVFESLFNDGNFFDLSYSNPSDYIERCWDNYSLFLENKKADKNNNNLNGKVFELIIATLMIRETLLPFFSQAKVAFVPNVEYDLVFYSQEKGPISISLKTSIRERYKQADLEALVLKNVHRKALCYLIVNDSKDAVTVNNKIHKGEVIALDACIFARSESMDELINDLKKYSLISPPEYKAIESGQEITAEKVENVKKRLSII